MKEAKHVFDGLDKLAEEFEKQYYVVLKDYNSVLTDHESQNSRVEAYQKVKNKYFNEVLAGINLEHQRVIKSLR